MVKPKDRVDGAQAARSDQPDADGQLIDASGGSAGIDASGGSVGVDASGVVAAGRADLDQLRQGRIDLDEYVRRQAVGATQHLVGHVSAERLADLRELLATQVRSDPSLADVVSRLASATDERSS